MMMMMMVSKEIPSPGLAIMVHDTILSDNEDSFEAYLISKLQAFSWHGYSGS